MSRLHVFVLGTPSDASLVRVCLLHRSRTLADDPIIFEEDNSSPAVWSILHPDAQYEMTDQKAKTIRKIFQTEPIDLVVIGNNRDFGLMRAVLVPFHLRPRTIVMWHEYTKGDGMRYSTLGFEHFTSRDQLKIKLYELLESLNRHSAA